VALLSSAGSAWRGQILDASQAFPGE